RTRPAAVAQAAQLVEDGVEAEALNELHGVIRQAIVLADGEDGHDVRVVQLRRRPRLPLKALQRRWAPGGGPRYHLEGDAAAEGDLLRLVDHAHAAAAHLAEDAIVAQLPQRQALGGAPRPAQARRALLLLDLFDLGQGGKQLANLVGELGVALGVLLHGR